MGFAARHVRVGLVGAVVVAALALTWLLPAGPAVVGGTRAATDVGVAYHIHTRRSDGTGSVEEVAAAAKRAGLTAVIVTDHGDGTRAVDPPRYIDGVLVVDAAEISTWGGHYVALGAAPSPYPLGGAPDTVVEDVAQLGGIGIAAHPGSVKDGLKWRAWDAPVDGVEWLNADSEWRDRPADLWRALVTYPWRPVETLAALLDRPAVELGQWDRLAARRRVVGLVAQDAHARVGLRGVGEPYDGAAALEIPSYEAMFRAFSNVVRLDRPLTGSASTDAAALIRAVAAGQLYAVVTGQAPAGRVAFSAQSGGQQVGVGGHLTPAGPVTFVFDADAPAGARTTLYCDGRAVANSATSRLTWTSDGNPGACRVEVTARGGVPWLATNPIYARSSLAVRVPLSLPEATLVQPLPGTGEASRWLTELPTGATGRVQASPGSGVDYTWRLGQGLTQYAAIRFDLVPGSIAAFDRLILRARADRPMRVWVQVRTPDGGGRRWGRSVYLDATARQTTVRMADLLPLDPGAIAAGPPADVTALLIVVDTVHTLPGSSGTVTFEEIWLAR